MPFAWSPAVLDDLYRLHIRQGLSAAQTAAALGGGLTRNAVLGKVQRMGWAKTSACKPGRKPKPKPDKPRLAKRPPVRRRDPFTGQLPLPPLREITVISTPRIWTEREAHQCCFPVGQPGAPGLQMSCCAPKMRGRSYCAPHWALMTLGEVALTSTEQETVAQAARRAA